MAIQREIEKRIADLIKEDLVGEVVNTTIKTHRARISMNDDNTITILLGEFSSRIGKVYEIIDKLDRGGLIEGEDRPDLTTAKLQLGPDSPVTIGNNAEIFVTSDNCLSLRVTPTTSEEEILAGIDVAAASIRADHSNSALEEAQSTLQAARDRRLQQPPLAVFPPQRTIKLVTDYLQQRVEAQFPDSHPNVIYTAPENPGDKAVFRVNLRYPEGCTRQPFNEFAQFTLTDIFMSGDVINHAHEERYTVSDPFVVFSLKGHPARLLRDIQRNDPDKLPQQKDGVGRA